MEFMIVTKGNYAILDEEGDVNPLAPFWPESPRGDGLSIQLKLGDVMEMLPECIWHRFPFEDDDPDQIGEVRLGHENTKIELRKAPDAGKSPYQPWRQFRARSIPLEIWSRWYDITRPHVYYIVQPQKYVAKVYDDMYFTFVYREWKGERRVWWRDLPYL